MDDTDSTLSVETNLPAEEEVLELTQLVQRHIPRSVAILERSSRRLLQHLFLISFQHC